MIGSCCHGSTQLCPRINQRAREAIRRNMVLGGRQGRRSLMVLQAGHALHDLQHQRTLHDQRQVHRLCRHKAIPPAKVGRGQVHRRHCQLAGPVGRFHFARGRQCPEEQGSPDLIVCLDQLPVFTTCTIVYESCTTTPKIYIEPLASADNNIP